MRAVKETFRRILKSTPIDPALERRSIRKWYQSKRQSVQTIEQAILSIQNRWSIQVEGDRAEPIFIFASGWRSGSTLLQRIVNSDPDTLLWGEPFPDSSLVQNLANSLRPFRESYPPDYNFLDSKNFSENDSPLSSRWTANLYPNFEHLFYAHRAFFERLYAQPAKEQGCSRWGFKEVRLTMDHAIYLKWLFPKAKFLFLYRNPYKAYRSCYDWRNLYRHWPHEPIPDPETFGKYWVSQVTEFLNCFEKVDGYLIKYEELCDRTVTISQIADYLQSDLDTEVIESRIGFSKDKEPSRSLLKRLEKVVSPVARPLGYVLDKK